VPALFAVSGATFGKREAQLAQAIATTDAACVLLCGDGAPIDENHAGRLIDSVQATGLACLIETDAGLAERLGADGLHIEADADLYAAARKLLGESANIGALCGLGAMTPCYSRNLAPTTSHLGRTRKALSTQSISTLT
jgi:thiamine monophosphate synthase